MPLLKDLRLVAEAATDSRGRPTVAVRASLNEHRAYGDVPAGASKGQDEAKTLSVAAAMAVIGKQIEPMVRQMPGTLDSVPTLLAIDHALQAHAGENFAAWGANATVPVSRALWRLGAAARGEPLWRLFHEALGSPARPVAPRCFFNVYNGGLHALRPNERLGHDRIDVQEIMVVPMTDDVAAAIACGDAIDGALHKRLVAAYGAERVGRADEAGLSVQGEGDTEAAMAHVVAAIEAAGFALGTQVQLALDVAAGSLAHMGGYRLHGQQRDSASMRQWLLGLVQRYPKAICSIEDGLEENDWDGWRALGEALAAHGVRTIGDDLFVTQPTRLKRGIASRAADAILIKVNQNGTIGGTLAVMRQAAEANMACVVSHRSGETLDDSIADLAFGAGAWGLKAGDPQPPAAFADSAHWVRRRKYLRLAQAQRQARGA